MTAATQSRSLSPALTRRAEVGWSDLAWLVWRQHRMLIGITALAVLVALVLFYWDSVDLNGRSAVYLEMIVMPAAAGVIGVFWGAPLISAEYEQRTQLVVWAQDVSPVRWLVAKMSILGAAAAVLWAILGVADSHYLQVLNSHFHEVSQQYTPWGFVGFESWIPLQMSYALFAFALGVAASALVRRTVASIGITMVLFTTVRFLVGTQRTNFLPPLRFSVPPTAFLFANPGANSLPIGDPYSVDAAGHQVNVPDVCNNYDTGVTDVACARAHGVVATVGYYQPESRLLPAHLIEFGIYLGIAALCVAIAWFGVRRRQRV